jgi:hypothetical protein
MSLNDRQLDNRIQYRFQICYDAPWLLHPVYYFPPFGGCASLLLNEHEALSSAPTAIDPLKLFHFFSLNQGLDVRKACHECKLQRADASIGMAVSQGPQRL